MPDPESVPEPILDAYRQVRDIERDTDEQELIQQDPAEQHDDEDLRRHDTRGDDQPTAESP